MYDEKLGPSQKTQKASPETLVSLLDLVNLSLLSSPVDKTLTLNHLFTKTDWQVLCYVSTCLGSLGTIQSRWANVTWKTLSNNRNRIRVYKKILIKNDLFCLLKMKQQQTSCATSWPGGPGKPSGPFSPDLPWGKAEIDIEIIYKETTKYNELNCWRHSPHGFLR